MRRLGIVLLLALSVGCHGTGEHPGRGAADAKQRLATATIGDPKTFNPLLVSDSASESAIDDVFDGLLRFDPKTMEMDPMLAQSWEYNATGTVCTFHLRHDVHWQDGAPFTAADVAFTFQAIFDDRVPNSIKRTLMVGDQPLKTEIVDDYTIRLILPRPFAPLFNALGFKILPKHILGAALEKGTFTQQWGINTPPEQIIGTGPYRMTRYVPAQFIEFKRNPTYWMRDARGQPLPYLRTVTLLIVPDQQTMYRKFLSGHTDVDTPRPEQVGDLQAKADQLNITVKDIGLETGSTFISFNRNPRHYVRDGKTDPRMTWFTDPYFLKAVAHAVDKQAMIRNCLHGHGKPAVADISPANTVYHNPHLSDYAYDLSAARRLLAAGGYVQRHGVLEDHTGNPVEFSLYTNAGNPVREKICAILKEDWAKLGMKVRYQPLPFATLVDKLEHTFDWDAVLIGFTGTPEPNNGANLWRSSGALHLWNPSQATPATPWEAEIDRLLEEGTRTLDVQKRRQFYWRIQAILHEQLAMIETVRQTEFSAYKRTLRNFQPTVWGVYRPELIRIAQ